MAKRNFNTITYSTSEFEATSRKIANYLRALAKRRSAGTVTADDVHQYLTNREGMRTQQTRTRLSFINSVLREPMFEQVGTVPSSRPEAKGRSITEWAI